MLFDAVSLMDRTTVCAHLSKVSRALLLPFEQRTAEQVLALRVQQVTVDLELALLFK